MKPYLLLLLLSLPAMMSETLMTDIAPASDSCPSEKAASSGAGCPTARAAVPATARSASKPAPLPDSVKMFCLM